MALATPFDAPHDAPHDAPPPAGAGSSASVGSSGVGSSASVGSSGVGSSATGPGLSARMASLHGELGSLLADLDPGRLLGADAASLYGDWCRLERLVVAAKTLLAPRIAESGHWEAEGHRSPAGLLASLEGGTPGQARRTLETGQRLSGLPGCADAVRRGTLSGPKLVEITQAAAVDPSAEGALLAGSDAEPLHVVKERCHQVRATAAGGDPVGTLARIHARRSFTSWTDAEGAFCFQGRDSAERGARLLARLVPVANRLRHDRRAAARGASVPRDGSEAALRDGSEAALRDGSEAALRDGSEAALRDGSEAALRADAFFLLVTGRRPEPPATAITTGTGTTTATGVSTTGDARAGGPGGDLDPEAPGGPGASLPLADPGDLGGVEDLVTAAPPATVIVRVDLAALRRGRALPGELCELDGHGPVPLPVVESLVDDAYLACVFTEAGDIRAVAHLGRTVNAPLRTALALRDRHCVVPGCGVAYSLEIDHVRPLGSGGRTELSNLALLCRHHHRMKTYDGWVLERTGPSDLDPQWRFTPQPPFGQEPDLGLDRPGTTDRPDRPEAVPRK